MQCDKWFRIFSEYQLLKIWPKVIVATTISYIYINLILQVLSAGIINTPDSTISGQVINAYTYENKVEENIFYTWPTVVVGYYFISVVFSVIHPVFSISFRNRPDFIPGLQRIIICI